MVAPAALAAPAAVAAGRWAFLRAAAGSTVTKQLVVRGGTAVIAYFTITGVVEEISLDSADEIAALEAAIPEVGGTIVAGVANSTLQVVEGLGRAVVQGIDSAFDAIRDKFIKGKEPDIIAGFTLGTLVILASVYLYQSVKNSNDAF